MQKHACKVAWNHYHLGNLAYTKKRLPKVYKPRDDLISEERYEQISLRVYDMEVKGDLVNAKTVHAMITGPNGFYDLRNICVDRARRVLRKIGYKVSLPLKFIHLNIHITFLGTSGRGRGRRRIMR